MGVELAAHLEGPEPWFATASGRFRFFVVNVRFDVTVGAHAPAETPGGADVLALMAAELDHPEAWSARRPATPPAALVLRPDVSEALLRPDDSVVAVQSVAPLGEPLDRLGELTPAQESVDVVATALRDAASGQVLPAPEAEDVLGWFAPAQFTLMRDEERLSAPSYEQRRAGVAFGGGGVTVADDALEAPAGHETEVWQPASGVVRGVGSVTIGRPADVELAMSSTARAAATRLGATAEVERVAIAPTTYVTLQDGAAERVVPAHAAGLAPA
jgi:hypothetical protein